MTTGSKMGNQRPVVLNPQRLNALEEWLDKTSITLTQVNGQRRYGGPPPGWIGPAPGPGCEVFISQIPREVYEDSLIPLFQTAGPLYEFRLMMNFSGQNRGFAYAKYRDPLGATAAIRTLHLLRLQDGMQLNVRRSTEKRQLCLGELPPGLGRNQVLEVLRRVSDEVEEVNLKAKGGGKEVMALVQYTSHHAASMAKKVLVQAFRQDLGISISVKWLTFPTKPRAEEDPPEEKALAPPPPPGVPPRRNLLPFRFHLATSCTSPVQWESQPPSPFSPQHFSRSVGGPAPRAHQPGGVPPGPPPGDPSSLLRWMCETRGLGAPLYHFAYQSIGPDGFLYFTYRVTIPGLPRAFCGVVHILPGTDAGTTEREVKWATAELVLKALHDS